jgi:uncharacterized protein YbaR (Trm112 family)
MTKNQKFDMSSNTCVSGEYMRKELMDILACPVCKGDLVLDIRQEEGDDIIEGTLYCGKCDEYYPIHGSIPDLLPPEIRD